MRDGRTLYAPGHRVPALCSTADRSIVLHALARQVDPARALDTNDVAVLNQLFWNNALTLRYGIGEIKESKG